MLLLVYHRHADIQKDVPQLSKGGNNDIISFTWHVVIHNVANLHQCN